MTLRRGFTLVELLCALVLLSIVGTTITRLLVGQQRFYASLDERLGMRAQLRDGADLVSAALRFAAVQGAPITLATDTAIELSTTIGAATVCAATGGRIDLTPEAPLTGGALTSFAVTPDSADEVLVYDTGSASSPPRWLRARILSIATRPASAACGTSPLINAVDVATAAVPELTVSPSIIIAPGAPVRIVRRARFDLYRGGDGLRYLGYRRCGLGCTTVQPISGPFSAPLHTAGALTFRYFGVEGAALPTPVAPAALARITRVEIALRAASRGVVELPGSGRAVARDSIVATATLRNAP